MAEHGVGLGVCAARGQERWVTGVFKPKGEFMFSSQCDRTFIEDAKCLTLTKA